MDNRRAYWWDGSSSCGGGSTAGSIDGVVNWGGDVGIGWLLCACRISNIQSSLLSTCISCLLWVHLVGDGERNRLNSSLFFTYSSTDILQLHVHVDIDFTHCLMLLPYIYHPSHELYAILRFDTLWPQKMQRQVKGLNDLLQVLLISESPSL